MTIRANGSVTAHLVDRFAPRRSPDSPAKAVQRGRRLAAERPPMVCQRSAWSTARRVGLAPGVDSSSSADSTSLSKRERPPRPGDGRSGLLAAEHVEVVARADRSQPLLVAGEVDVGLLELGVRRPAAAALAARSRRGTLRALHSSRYSSVRSRWIASMTAASCERPSAGCEAFARGRPPRAGAPRAVLRRAGLRAVAGSTHTDCWR